MQTIGSDLCAKRADFKVVGYFPAWEDNLGLINYGVITHVNYAFAIPTAQGGLLPLQNAHTAQRLIAEAHAHSVPVFLSVGGWSWQDIPLEATFAAATDTPAKVTSLADAIFAMCEQYGFDGIDVDWEHPRVDTPAGAQYESLILALARRLHPVGKLLTIAVLSGVDAEGRVMHDSAAHTDAVLETVDWVNIMAYDGGEGETHSPYDFAVNCGSYWHCTRGLPAHKTVLGVPFYARPAWASYSAILAAVPGAHACDYVDLHGADAWYNGIPTIRRKTAYALQNLGGVMIWELSEDTADQYSLQSAIGQTIRDYEG